MATIVSSPRLPLRTAIIGLSASAITSWAAEAHLPSLLHPHGQRDYTITALCNSSVEAAKAAIKAFNLPSDTKAYGNPQDLGADADIDVVICNTRVDKHYETIVDSVKAGKKVFVEWPVTSSVRDTQELVRLAEASGSQVAVGLQGRWAPPIVRVKELLTEKREKLGKVLSSDIRGFGGTMGSDGMKEGLEYFADRKVGGNVVVIGFGHMIDWTQAALGELIEGATHARTQIQHPENKIFGSKNEVVKVVKSDVPDLVVVTGSLTASNTVTEGATLTVDFRRGAPFKDDPALTWSIYCERGEIQLKAFAGMALNADACKDPFNLKIQYFEDDSVEDVTWDWNDDQKDIPVRGRSIMKTLYAFAEEDSNGWASLESAARRARQIDGWLESGKW